MIFVGNKNINWITEDCGNNIRAMNHGRRVNDY